MSFYLVQEQFWAIGARFISFNNLAGVYIIPFPPLGGKNLKVTKEGKGMERGREEGKEKGRREEGEGKE